MTLTHLKAFKPYFLTAFFGSGKVISTVGSSFYALDKLVIRSGGNTDASYNTILRILTAISGGTSIAFTRIPEMWLTYSGTRNRPATNRDNRLAVGMSFFFSLLGYMTACLTAMSAYLGGRSISKVVADESTFTLIMGIYAALSAYLSFTVYSVSRVGESAYAFGVYLTELNAAGIRTPNRAAIATILASSACAVSTATMFYYSIKHSIPLLFEDIVGKKLLSSRDIELIAYLSVIPSEATFAFSQVNSVYRFIHNDRSFRERPIPTGITRNLIFITLNVINLMSIPLQGAIYFEYMAELLQDKKVPVVLLLLLSILNALSSAFIYFTFTASKATDYTKALLTNFSFFYAMTDNDMQRPLAQDHEDSAAVSSHLHETNVTTLSP